jgi:phenylalanyl-tRNA synthetase beta chain
MEEIARVYGYRRIPETRMADELPPQRGNPDQEMEEVVRDILANLGLQEVISHRLTTPEKEGRLFLDGRSTITGTGEIILLPYVRLANPIVSDQTVLRQDLLASVLEIGGKNTQSSRSARGLDRLALFEIGKVYLSHGGSRLPDEPRRLAVLVAGSRSKSFWQGDERAPVDYFDLKGLLEAMFEGLHLNEVEFLPDQNPSFHPGRCARIIVKGQSIGWCGELHPLVQERYELESAPLQAAELELELLQKMVPERYEIISIPAFPPVLEDLAVIVAEDTPVHQVLELVREAGGEMVADVSLFDVYRGGQAGQGRKSLAFSIMYQAVDRTLTDEEVADVRRRIIRQLEQGLGARLRA